MLVFALAATREFGVAVAAALGEPLAPLEERTFEDGEHKIRPLVDPEGQDVFVVQSLHGDPEASGDEKLVRLLMFLAALRDHGARRVTAVVPYLAYARKDRRTKPFDPVSLRVVAQLLEASGCHGLITLEVHNPAAFDNAFRLPAVNLEPHDVYADAVARVIGDGPVAVASPDVGGVKRAQAWREVLEASWGRRVGQAFVDKRRSAGVVSGGEIVAGDVREATVLVIDDLIATFGTIERAALALTRAGARRVLAFAAHGLFVGPAAESVLRAPVERVFVTDSVPIARVASPAARAKIEVLPCAPLLAAEIRKQGDAWR